MPFPILRSRLVWLAALVLLLGGAGLTVRYWLGGYAVRTVLRLTGASAIHYDTVRATPWRVEVAGLDFRYRTHAFSARRVTVQREHWWMASLGQVRVEGAVFPVVLDGSDLDPWHWSTYEEGGLGDEAVQPPFQSLDLDGEIIVRLSSEPDRAIAVKLEGRPRTGSSWIGSLVAEGPGFRLAGGGSLLRAGQELDFQVQSADLDLGQWANHIQRLVSLPGGPWEMGGRLTGVGEGKVTAKRFAATARVTLRDGHMQADRQDIAATGAEADLEFSDLWKFRTKSGSFRLAELRIGRLPINDLSVDFGLWDGTQFTVSRATGTLLGGRVEAEPFKYHLNDRTLGLTLRVAGLRAPRLLALTNGVTPRLGGRLGGRLPLRIHDYGVQVDNGELHLEPGYAADLQLNPTTLLRSGAEVDDATAGVFRAAGRQSVVVRLDDLRLDLHPPGLPLGTSAKVEVTGKVDDTPVHFVTYINGAVERFLRLLP